MENPLISVLVVSYNNQQFIYECLRSIFSQTYPTIEVLIGDDCSTDFDAETLINWINGNRTSNIVKIAVFHSEENRGTVANLEKLQEKSSGAYLFNIAADDVLYDEHVLENLYARAMEIGEPAEVIVAETEMWDHELKKLIGHFMTPDAIYRIENYTPMQLFAICAYNIILPASYLYRRTVLERVGKLSDKYRLVEDVPTHLRLLAQGVRPYYMGISPSIKHRDGGISHGNSRQSSLIFLMYCNDIINLYTYEIEPYMHLIPESDQNRIRTKYEDECRAYYKIRVPAYYNARKNDLENAFKDLKDAEQAKKLPPTQENSVQEVAEMVKSYRKREAIKKAAFVLSRKKTVISAVLMALLCFISAGALSLLAAQRKCMLLFGYLSAVFAACAVMVNIILRIRHRQH